MAAYVDCTQPGFTKSSPECVRPPDEDDRVRRGRRVPHSPDVAGKPGERALERLGVGRFVVTAALIA